MREGGFDGRMIADTGNSTVRGGRGLPLARAGTRAVAFAEENGTLVMVVCAAAFAFLVRLPTALAADSWMSLLSGREIVGHGLPTHDTITVWAHGRQWVDQQWLAQVAMYGLERLGGFRLALIAHAALAAGGFTAACAVARRRGASAISVTWIGALSLYVFYPEAVTMRAQSFAYGLFVAVLAILLRDSRQRSNAALLVFPLLVLWANVHGSVVVGAALVSLYGLLALRTARKSGWVRPIVLTVLPWGCMLASPYAASLPSYYRWVFFGVHFNRYITEWAPTSLSLAALPVYVIAIGGAWLFGRARRRPAAFEALAFLATAAMALEAKRNMPWLGLAAVVILPTLLDSLRTTAPAEPRRVNRLLSAVAILGTAATIAVVASKPESWFLRGYPSAPARLAAAAAGKSKRIFANEAYADWLVWKYPGLAGRIAFDARFELLTERQLTSLLFFRLGVGSWAAPATGYAVLVLSGSDESRAISALLDDRRVTRVADDAGIVVLRRKPAA
jgi:hypothetical protein